MALFRTGGGGEGIDSVTLVSSVSSYTATADGIYAMVVYASSAEGVKVEGSVSITGGTALYTFAQGGRTYTSVSSVSYRGAFAYGLRVAKLTKGQTLSATVGNVQQNGVDNSSIVYKTVKIG